MDVAWVMGVIGVQWCWVHQGRSSLVVCCCFWHVCHACQEGNHRNHPRARCCCFYDHSIFGWGGLGGESSAHPPNWFWFPTFLAFQKNVPWLLPRNTNLTFSGFRIIGPNLNRPMAKLGWFQNLSCSQARDAKLPLQLWNETVCCRQLCGYVKQI